jgi:hypothetical protein
MTPAARRYATDALLRDGSSIHIRALRADDEERLADHFRRLGPESVWYRFFGVKKDAAEIKTLRIGRPVVE